MSVLNSNIVHPNVSYILNGRIDNFMRLQQFKYVYSHTDDLLNLAACENHKAIASTVFGNRIAALPQTAQMLLETYLLLFDDVNSIYTQSISYRDEEIVKDSRHLRLFSMLEIEQRGGFDKLKMFLELFSEYFFGKSIKFVSYFEALELVGKKLNDTLSEADETVIVGEYDCPVGLYYFPESSNPYFNMSRTTFTYKGKDYRVAEKIDLLVKDREGRALEVGGFAKRSSDILDIINNFETLMDGAYKNTLYAIAGKSAINKEFDQYLTILQAAIYRNMAERWGGGIGILRLLETMQVDKEPLVEHTIHGITYSKWSA